MALLSGTWLFAAAGGPGPAPSSPEACAFGEKLDRLEKDGAAAAAPGELETARALLASCEEALAAGSPLAPRYAKILGLEVALLGAAIETARAQEEASDAEKDMLDARALMKVEQAAYEYFVDQILASGLVSQWAMP